MKKLYKVEASWYVMAEDDSEASSFKPHDLMACDVLAFEAAEVGVDSSWWDAIPWESDNDKTCGQIMKELENSNG